MLLLLFWVVEYINKLVQSSIELAQHTVSRSDGSLSFPAFVCVSLFLLMHYRGADPVSCLDEKWNELGVIYTIRFFLV